MQHYDFTGVHRNYTLNFTANGTPDITAQTDTDSLTFQVNVVFWLGLSSFNITLSILTYEQSTCANFTDNSASNPLSAGAVTTNTARRYTSGTINTNTVNNVYDGLSGTLTAMINGTADGTKPFTTATNENGTFTSLVVSGQLDANDSIGSSYPTGFYQTFDAKINRGINKYTVGVNDQRLTYATGNTNYVAVICDDMINNATVMLVVLN